MLTSIHNSQVKHIISLQRRKNREAFKEFVIEGWRFLEEALHRGAEIKQVYVCREREQKEWAQLLEKLQRDKVPVEDVDEKLLYKMSGTIEPQGIIAVVTQPEFSWTDINVDSKTVLLIIDGVQDPGNLGTILRTALAAGVGQICCTPGTVDVFNPKVLRSTMGAIFSIVLLQNQGSDKIMEFCRSHSLNLVTADIEGEQIYEMNSLQLPLALVIGNEGNGPSEAFKQASKRITIPMSNKVESLNAAIASGVLLYEIVRRRDFL